MRSTTKTQSSCSFRVDRCSARSFGSRGVGWRPPCGRDAVADRVAHEVLTGDLADLSGAAAGVDLQARPQKKSKPDSISESP